MKHRDIIRELNNESERRLLKPLLFGLLLVTLVPLLGIILVLQFADQVDKFTSDYPVFTGVSFIMLASYGWFKFGKSRGLW